jgi:hypothetical protein
MPWASLAAMSTSEKTGRAWVAAIVTTVFVVLLLAGCGLLREVLEDQDITSLQRPDNVLGTYFYNPMAPVGVPGIVGDADFSDSITQMGGGLVPVVVLVFLFTWAAGRAARAGTSFTVLLGAWLGTILGTGLGGAAAFQVFVWQSDFPSNSPGLQQIRLDSIQNGLYWGAIAGLLVGLVGMLAFAASRRRATDEPDLYSPPPQHAASGSDPDDTTSYPPPPAGADPASGTPPETVIAPKPPPDYSR